MLTIDSLTITPVQLDGNELIIPLTDVQAMNLTNVRYR
jgi:hypothetical protein